jgi:hypothetical protein
MKEEARAELERLDTLRELALCGSEEKGDGAGRAYEEHRSRLLSREQCETPEQTNNTKDLEYGR